MLLRRSLQELNGISCTIFSTDLSFVVFAKKQNLYIVWLMFSHDFSCQIKLSEETE